MLPCRPSESSASAVPSFPPPRAFPTFSGQRASDQPHPRPSSPLLHPRQHQWGAGAVGTVPLPPRGAGGAPTERTRPRVLTGIRRPRAEGSTPKSPFPLHRAGPAPREEGGTRTLGAQNHQIPFGAHCSRLTHTKDTARLCPHPPRCEFGGILQTLPRLRSHPAAGCDARDLH